MSSVQTVQEEALVINKVKELIANNEGFTAFNITKAIRKDLEVFNGYINHYVVRDFVHMMYDNGEMKDYYLDFITIPDTGMTAKVYLPPNMNVQDYMENEFNVVPQADKGLNWDLDSSPINNGVPYSYHNYEDDDFDTDARGRACVPKYVLEDLGIYSGDEVCVKVDKAQRTITIKPIELVCCYDEKDVYVVDKSGNLRIGTQRNKLSNKFSVKLDVTNDSVVITFV